MGSYIGIGLVYKNTSVNRIEKELRNLVKYLVFQEGSIISIKFSKDEDGSEWVEYNLINNLEIENFYFSLSDGYLGQIQMVCDILNIQKLSVAIRVEKADKNYFGLLLDIDEDELAGSTSKEKINKTTERIIELLNDLYKITSFEYAFCDNEAEIQYSPIEFQSLGERNVYSIAVLPDIEDKKELKIIKSSWEIDGLTTREI